MDTRDTGNLKLNEEEIEIEALIAFMEMMTDGYQHPLTDTTKTEAAAE